MTASSCLHRLIVMCAQAVTKKTWEDDTNGRLMMQMKGIGETMTRKLCSAGITNLRQMVRSSPLIAQLSCRLQEDGMQET